MLMGQRTLAASITKVVIFFKIAVGKSLITTLSHIRGY